MNKDKVLAELDELDRIKIALINKNRLSMLMRVVFNHINAIRSEVEKSEPTKPEPEE